MRLWNCILRSVIPLGILGVLAGCGGGGGGTAVTVQNAAPTVALGSITAASVVTDPSALSEYIQYNFSATATDPDIGDSVAKYEWDFGDGSTFATTATGTVSHAYATSGTLALRVRAYDSHGLTSNWATKAITVAAVTSPITVSVTSPTAATTLQTEVGSTVNVVFNLQIADSGSGTVSASGIVVSPGDSAATVATPVDNGSGAWSVTVTYPAASAVGTRVVAPSVVVTDSLGVSSASVALPSITISTSSGTNAAPVIAVTNPATLSTSGYTSKAVTLAFTLTDADGDAVTYTVDWGDGTTGSTASVTTGTQTGAAVSLTHTYADSFTSSSKSAAVKINATDGRKNGTASEVDVNYAIAYNTYPTAAITSPQASGTVSAAVLSAVKASSSYSGNENVDIVVLPRNGQLIFNGTATAPGSGDSALTYSWTIPGGVLTGTNSSLSAQNPGQVLFAGTSGVIVANLVEFTVLDAFNRSSKNALNAKPATFRKWVVVDGVNSQDFTLSFKYRMKSDDNGAGTLSLVTTSANGLGALVQVFQDGLSNTYAVQDQAGTLASVSIPVRSDLPFYIKIPSFNSNDTRAYMMRIPNSPLSTNNPYYDPSLVSNSATTDSSAFSFDYPSASAAPWNPRLELVTAQGFAAEGATANLRSFQGTNAFVMGKTGTPNDRWLSRMSVPINDVNTSAIQWEQNNNSVATFTGLKAYQSFADWPIVLLGYGTPDTSSTAGNSDELKFKLDYGTYSGDSAVSKSFTATGMQAFRIPAGTTSPYDLDAAGWGIPSAISALNPTEDASIPSYYNTMINGSVGSSAFSGGLKGFTVPYDANDADRPVLSAPTTRSYNGIRSVFSYAEYIWNKVWAWPLVLNAADLAYSQDPGSYAHFRYSDPAGGSGSNKYWPYMTAIGSGTTLSAFDLNANGASTFDPTKSSVGTGGATPDSTAVGHFFWTAYTPSYSAAMGSVISRTWLANASGRPPINASDFVGHADGDATAAFGFLPPQDTVVDKRSRNADGTINTNDKSLSGYRVTWFNPTKDANAGVVPPDFWVVELNVGGSISDFMIPASYPAAANYPASTVDPATMPVLTDATATLTRPSDGAKVVAPGYCWFDVPSELRPTTGASATLTVFAVKSILRSDVQKFTGRKLTRPEWIDAIKTATAHISVVGSSADVSFAHKIPFNYCWDIVVANGPITTVAQ